jgi:hypothetical protein
MRNLILSIIGSLIFFGCSSLDVAKKALQNGDVNTSKKIYKEWADRGFGFADLKLSKLSTDDNEVIKNALSAYKKGFHEAANIIFYTYYKTGNIKKAKFWFEKVLFDKMNSSEYKAYLAYLFYHTDNRQIFLNRIIKYAENSGNQYILYQLGKYFEIYLKRYKKSMRYYRASFKKGYIPAGIRLANLYIYNLNEPLKGVELLRDIASRDNGAAAYEIAKFLENNIANQIKNIRRGCITSHFSTPMEFFTKKIKILKFRDLYIKENILPWLRYSYSKGYVKAKFKMIELDVKYNNFISGKTFCKMNLKQAVKFLETSEYMQAKLTLAKIFEHFVSLHQVNRAEQIYNQFALTNKKEAYWHLYQLYKRFYPKAKRRFGYLDYLVKAGFEPAIIENAFINADLHTLKFFARQNNILALTYLASIYAKEQKKLSCKILNKICSLKSGVDVKLDIKIANNCINNTDKKGAVYYFYANRGDNVAEYLLSKLYDSQRECEKFNYWLKKARKDGNFEADILYSKLILEEKVKGNKDEALAKMISYANQNPKTYIYLGDTFFRNIHNVFKPKKAIKFYNLAIKNGINEGYLKLISLYSSIDDAKIFFDKIDKLYKKYMKTSNKTNVKLQYVNFLYSYEKYKMAREYIFNNNLQNYSLAKYILLKTKPEEYFVFKGKNISIKDDGRLLLLYAKKLFEKNKKEALYYTFIASMKQTPGSTDEIVKLLRFFTKDKAEKIYYKAKKDYEKSKKYK